MITTYEQMRIHSTVLSKPRWSYVVLDEGHKIRNPDAEVMSLSTSIECVDSPAHSCLKCANVCVYLVMARR